MLIWYVRVSLQFLVTDCQRYTYIQDTDNLARSVIFERRIKCAICAHEEKACNTMNARCSVCVHVTQIPKILIQTTSII